MKKWGFLIAFGAAFTAVLWLSVKERYMPSTLTYIDYDMHDRDIVKSETTYITEQGNNVAFEVCQSRSGDAPCKQIKGVQHGVQKWYEAGVLQYEDFYEHGKRIQTIAYYNNGLKQKECRYENNKLTQKSLYGRHNGNPLVAVIFYKENEKIKQYYMNNRIHKEEKYQNGKLVSRRIYDNDGRLQRLEEYNFFGNVDSFDNFFDGFDSANPFLFDRNIPRPNERDELESLPDAQDNIWI